MTHPPPKTTRTDMSRRSLGASGLNNDLEPVLRFVRVHFYHDREHHFYRDRPMLLKALTWPAAWLDAQALCIAPEDYNELLLRKLRQIQLHGDPKQYGPYPPQYIMKALQDHCRHHREAIYLRLKHAGYTIDRIAADIEGMARQNNTNILAEAHQLLRQNHRKKHTTTPSPQMTLGL